MQPKRTQPSKEPMSPVDHAWLRMESPTNLMMIAAILVFESPISKETLKQTIETRLLTYSRFKQRVIHENGKPYWEDDPHFDLDNHLHRIALPGKADKSELQALTSDLSSTPLDFSKPLWQFHLINNYHLDKHHTGTALIIRIHHCIADGLALVRVMLSMTDDTPTPKVLQHLTKQKQTEDNHSLPHFLEPARNLLHATFHIGQELLKEGQEIVKHPSHLLDIAKEGLSIGSEITRIGLIPDDSKALLKGELSGRKNVAWAEPLELEDVRKTAHALGGTINDVLLCVASSALREYLLDTNKKPDGSNIHVAVPCNLRPLDQPIKTLGNQFGLVIVELPIGIKTPIARFKSIKQTMQALKNSYQAQIFYGLLGVLGKGPSVLEQTALELLSKKASAVMTNVPGPKHPLYLAGSRLLQPMVWVPQSGDVGIGLSILSYSRTIQFGVVADKQLMKSPEMIIKHVHQSYQELKQLTTST